MTSSFVREPPLVGSASFQTWARQEGGRELQGRRRDMSSFRQAFQMNTQEFPEFTNFATHYLGNDALIELCGKFDGMRRRVRDSRD